MTKEASHKSALPSILLYTSIVGAILLLCISQALLKDIDDGKWRSVAVRVFIIFLVSFFSAFRINESLQLKWRQLAKQLPLLLLFLTVLAYPLVSQFSYLKESIQDVTHSLVAGNPHSPKTFITLLKSFPGTYKKYMAEHFDLPKSLIYLNGLVKVYLLGVSPNNNIALGKHGIYFEGWGARKVEKGIVEDFDNIADYMGQMPFSQDQLRQWKKVLEEREYWLKQQGVDYVFVLAPTKGLVYPEYLPNSIREVSKGETRYDQLTRFLASSSTLHFIDLRPALLRAKKAHPYPLLFYKTDFHWNFFGSFIGYQTIIDNLREMFPQYRLPHPELSEFTMSIAKHWAHPRILNMIGLPASLLKNDEYITMVPKPGGPYASALDLPKKGIYDVYPPERPVKAADGTSVKLRLILNPKAPMRSILLLGDSFLEKCVYFFSADARRVLNYRTIVNFPDFILHYEKPDIVIQEILNMFILGKPPQNPPSFESSYLRGKFSDNADHIIVKKGQAGFVQTASGNSSFEIRLPDGPAPTEEEVRIARTTLNCRNKGSLTIRLYTADDKSSAVFHRNVSPGRNEEYLEFPVHKISRVTFSASKTSDPSFVPIAFEVRSDKASGSHE